MAGLLDLLGLNQQPRPQQPMNVDPMEAQQPVGFLGQLRQFNENNPGILSQIGAGMMAGNPAEGFRNAGILRSQNQERMEERAKANKTRDWLVRNRGMTPEDADAIIAGGAVGQFMKPDDAGKLTTSLQEYEFARNQGYGGSFMDFQLDQKRAGASSNNITVGGGRFGTIPQGYELIDGPDGARMRAIPGGPEDTTKKDALAQGQADVATRVVTSAAQRAREAAQNRNFGHVGQGVASNIPWTDSAEVARQVEVLKSTAKIENLTAMRAASPTGGALGSVTEKESDMLAAKSGALDPSSPTFQRDLDDYELTLLQVVHGPEEGARIFSETRQNGGAVQPPAVGGNTTGTGVQWSIEP